MWWAWSIITSLQAQRVGDHRDRTHRHRRRRDHRVEPAGRRDGNRDDVVAERPEQVLADDRHGAAREVDAAGDARDVAADQRDVGRFDRDVGAAADGEADVGGGQRRRVVDAVADHADLVAFFLQALRISSSLSAGVARAITSIDADFARDVAARRPRRRRWPSPSSGRADAAARWLRCAPSRGWSAMANSATQLAVDGDEHRRLALLGRARRPAPAGRCAVDAGCFEQRGVADQDRAGRRSVARTPWPGMASKLESRRWRHAARACTRRRWRAPGSVRNAASTPATSASSRRFVVAGDGRKSVTTGLPSVMVPVLSNTSVSSLAAVSSASPLRM